MTVGRMSKEITGVDCSTSFKFIGPADYPGCANATLIDHLFETAQDAYDFGPILADVVAEYLQEYTPYSPFTDGRIKRLDAE